MSAPVVAVCIPSGRTWEAEMAVSLIAVLGTTPCRKAVLWASASQISEQRNGLVKRALRESDVTHLFWVDSDMVLPQTTLKELLAHKKQIVGATYCKKIPPYEMTGRLRRSDGNLKPADLMPGGCMLVEADVYRAISWPWYFEVPHIEEQIITSEDYSFCEKARAAGFEIWCDLDLSQRLGHLGSQTVRFTAK